MRTFLGICVTLTTAVLCLSEFEYFGFMMLFVYCLVCCLSLGLVADFVSL